MSQRTQPSPLPRSQLRGDWLDLGFVRDVLSQQRYTFVAFFLTVFGVSLAGSVLATREFEAMALIHLLPRTGKEVQVDDVVSSDAAGYMEARERARTQIQIIQSRAIRDEVVRLYNSLGYDDLEPTPEGLEALGQRLSVGPREDTQLVEIRVRHTDPERAALLANLFAQVYRDGSLDARRETARETRDWLDVREDEFRDAVERSNQALTDFKLTHDVVDIDEAVDSTTARLAALQRTMGETTTERLVLETAINEHRKLLKRGDTQVLTGMFDDPALRALAQQRAEVVTQAAEIQARYGEQHPEHRKAVGQVQRIDELLLVEVQRNIDAELARLNMLINQERRLEAELEAVEGELARAQRLQQEYDTLRTEHDRARRFYEQLGERGSEVDLQSRTGLSEVRIVDQALPPTRPASPNVPLNLAVGWGVGVVGGFGLALLRYRGREVIERETDIEAFFGEPPLGVLPTFPFARRQADRLLYSHDHPRSLLADSLRGVTGILDGLLPGDRPARVVVTSSGEAEGKTTIAAGLAIAWARQGRTVLLVEVELARPRYHDAFRLEAGPGLAEVLVDPGEADAAVRTTRVPGLHVLPGGRGPGPANSRLAAPELAQVLGRLEQRYPVVVLDVPSATLLADARGLAAQTHGVVIGARRGLVTRPDVAHTIEGVRNTGGRVLGVVLNDVPVAGQPEPLSPPGPASDPARAAGRSGPAAP